MSVRPIGDSPAWDAVDALLNDLENSNPGNAGSVGEADELIQPNETTMSPSDLSDSTTHKEWWYYPPMENKERPSRKSWDRLNKSYKLSDSCNQECADKSSAPFKKSVDRIASTSKGSFCHSNSTNKSVDGSASVSKKVIGASVDTSAVCAHSILQAIEAMPLIPVIRVPHTTRESLHDGTGRQIGERVTYHS